MAIAAGYWWTSDKALTASTWSIASRALVHHLGPEEFAKGYALTTEVCPLTLMSYLNVNLLKGYEYSRIQCRNFTLQNEQELSTRSCHWFRQ